MDNLHSHMSFSVTLVGSCRWIVTIKPGEHTYDRKVLTASKKFIVDAIHLCPKDPSKNIEGPIPAVCEICGDAFCDGHIFNANNRYYYEKHRSGCEVI